MNQFPIIVKDVSKSFKDLLALDSVSFQVGNGELFGLIGPDGAGKTTLFRILTTLMLADVGNAIVNGYDVVKDYQKIRSSVGYMPGRFSLYQDLSVEENLHFFATIFGTTIEENYDLIKDIYQQIEPFKNRKAGKLSGGMKQKLALSCALIHAPSVLFLDEPTTGVDPVSRKEFWEMLGRLKSRGITIIVSTPYMDEATLCDRIALIQHGKIMQIDNPASIISQFPKPLYSVSSHLKLELVEDLRSYEDAYSAFPFGNEVHLVGKTEIYPDQIQEYLVKKGHQSILIQETKATIEDCFMFLMQKDQSVDS